MQTSIIVYKGMRQSRIDRLPADTLNSRDSTQSMAQSNKHLATQMPNVAFGIHGNPMFTWQELHTCSLERQQVIHIIHKSKMGSCSAAHTSAQVHLTHTAVALQHASMPILSSFLTLAA